MSKTKSGGILVDFKERLDSIISIVETKSKIVQWIVIAETIISKKIAVGTVYLPPKQSPYASVEQFNELEVEISRFDLEDYNLIICGILILIQEHLVK